MTISLQDSVDFNTDFFENSLKNSYKSLLRSFKKISIQHNLFHLSSLFLLLLESVILLYSLFSLDQTYIALNIAAIFLTLFLYTALFFYLQAKKPDQFLQLKEQLIQTCRKSISVPEGEADHHLSIAQACIRLAIYLKDYEQNFYTSSFMKKKWAKGWSAFFHFGDIFFLKQLLLGAAIEEHNTQIRVSATDMEVHASLASTYSLLSKQFLEAKKKLDSLPLTQWKHRKLYRTLEEKFRISAQRAVEEFTILQSQTPEDPWIHQMLARTYQDLDMPEKEIAEYEKIASLTELETYALLRLGILYFEQGENAKGLAVYEKLKGKNIKKAEELISYYGCFKNQILSFELES